MSTRYVGPGDGICLRDLADPNTTVKQLLWGDFLNVVAEQGDLLKVAWGSTPDGQPQHYWVKRAETTEARPLEVVF